MNQEELKYLLALKEIKGIGDILARKLIQEFGSARDVFKIPMGKALKIPRITESIAKKIANFQSFDWIEKEIAWCESESIQIIPFYSKDYPQKLLHCHDAPLLLFAKGNIDLNPRRSVSIVGTRASTSYGQDATERIIEVLKPFQATIFSGLALGIDSIAHKASINQGLPTIGALGHAFNQIYPRENQDLAKRMLEQGGLITEFSRKSEFDRTNFPMRNRIVAGISDATIIVESKGKGGAMITAGIAHSYSREVVAVPGRWNDPVSQGPNKLIKTLQAQALTHPDDLPEILGWKVKNQLVIENFIDKKYRYQHLDEVEMKIVACMQEHEPSSMDSIHYATEIPINKLSAILLSMEFKGVIKALPGKIFQLK